MRGGSGIGQTGKRKRYSKIKQCTVLVCVMWMLSAGGIAAADGKTDGANSAAQIDRGADLAGEDPETSWDLLDRLDFAEVEKSLDEMIDLPTVSFSGFVKGLMDGEIPLNWEDVLQTLSDILFLQLRAQKDLAVQILLIVLASAVFSNFVRVFESSQIAEISFYMMYLLISVLLIRSFLTMNEIARGALQNLNVFMKVLLPPYLVTVVFSAGSVSALGFYQVTLLAIHILQVLIIKIVLPLIQFYLLLLILNEMTKEDYFSRFAELLKTGIEWGMKSAAGITIGLQTVQCLIAPAVDSLKNSAAHRLARAIPGIGNVLDAAAETVAASALVIKNAVGVAGMLAILMICLVPIVKLAVNLLMFRVLCALIQPISEKRMVDCVESVSEGASLLMGALSTGMTIFLISLAMITASVKGG